MKLSGFEPKIEFGRFASQISEHEVSFTVLATEVEYEWSEGFLPMLVEKSRHPVTYLVNDDLRTPEVDTVLRLEGGLIQDDDSLPNYDLQPSANFRAVANDDPLRAAITAEYKGWQAHLRFLYEDRRIDAYREDSLVSGAIDNSNQNGLSFSETQEFLTLNVYCNESPEKEACGTFKVSKSAEVYTNLVAEIDAERREAKLQALEEGKGRIIGHYR